MGKRSRKQQKTSGPRTPPSDLLQPADSSCPSSPTSSAPAKQTPSIRDEIEESLAKIYESFFQEFGKRIQERRSRADPLDARQLQRSILDKKVRDKLVERVRTLTRAIGSSDVYDLFQDKTSQFVGRLLETVKDTEDSRLALGLLEDSYEILENAIEVVEGLIQFYSGPQIIMHNGKTLFYHLIQEDEQLKTLLEQGSEYRRDPPIYELLESSEDLEEEESEFQQKIAMQERLQTMSIDELITFINDPKKGKKADKGSGRSTADGSKSPEGVSESDTEIEEFRERLEKCWQSRRKIKPKLSEDWLRRLGIPGK